MEVKFLSEEERGMLFHPKDEEEDEKLSDDLPMEASAKEQTEELGEAVADRPARPSLHPITVDTIDEGLRLRAQNSTLSWVKLYASNVHVHVITILTFIRAPSSGSSPFPVTLRYAKVQYRRERSIDARYAKV
jgi:hypothetical protein